MVVYISTMRYLLEILIYNVAKDILCDAIYFYKQILLSKFLAFYPPVNTKRIMLPLNKMSIFICFVVCLFVSSVCKFVSLFIFTYSKSKSYLTIVSPLPSTKRTDRILA